MEFRIASKGVFNGDIRVYGIDEADARSIAYGVLTELASKVFDIRIDSIDVRSAVATETLVEREFGISSDVPCFIVGFDLYTTMSLDLNHAGVSNGTEEERVADCYEDQMYRLSDRLGCDVYGYDVLSNVEEFV